MGTTVSFVADLASPTTDDASLVHAVAAGDRGALNELYRRHAPWLTARLTRRCGDPDLVDTAIQETFLAVWRQADKWKPTGEVAAWIWTIGIRRLIDQLRKRPPPAPIDDEQILRQVVVEEVPLALEHTELGSAFAALETELQHVLAAVVFCGLSNREAAQLLRLPVGTVKSRLRRARAQLKAMI